MRLIDEQYRLLLDSLSDDASETATRPPGARV